MARRTFYEQEKENDNQSDFQKFLTSYDVDMEIIQDELGSIKDLLKKLVPPADR